MYKFSLSFFLLWTALFVGTIADIFLTKIKKNKKNGIANWPIEGKKNTIFYIIVFIVKTMVGQ